MNIDELVVELKLDPSNFTKGQKEAVDSFRKSNEEMERLLKNTEAQSKNTGHAFTGMTSAAEGLFTTLAGAGLVSFAHRTMEGAAAVGRMAVNAAEATRDMDAFGRMVDRNGGSAENAKNALVSLQATMQNARWGNASSEFWLGLGQVGGSLNDSPSQIVQKLAAFADTHNAQEVHQTGTRLGLPTDVVNQALRGSVQMMKDFKEAQEGALSPQQVKNMQDAQRGWRGLGQEIQTTANNVFDKAAPAFAAAAEATTKWAKSNQGLVDTFGSILTVLTTLAALKPALWLLRLLGLANPYVLAATAGTAAGVAAANQIPKETIAKYDEQYPILGAIDSLFGLNPNDIPKGAGGAFKDQAEKEAYIRAQAAKRGIDPDIAMAVARSEGFNNPVGDNGTSFGAFQLHTSPGGRDKAVGDQFKNMTGLDPSDPKNERQTIDFALDDIRAHGWHDYHGAKRVGISDQQGIGTTVNIQNVNLPNVKNGRDFVRETRSIAANANSPGPGQ